MANKFLNWIDRVALPVAGFVAVTSTILMCAIIVARLFFKF